MKASIALINSSIELKKDNGKMGYNFYEWLQQAKKDFRPDLSLKELWFKITGAACTEHSFYGRFPI
jgi:hypothetical protein